MSPLDPLCNPVSSPLDPDPYKPSPPITHSVGKWNPIRRNQDDSDEEDSDSEEEVVERVLERDGPEDDLGEPDVDGEREEETLENPASSSEDLSDGQMEDMVEDLHNLLFLHGPQPQVQGEGGAVRVEEQENVEDDEIVVDDLPPEYRYLRQLSYNQPRQPRKGDVVKYFDFNYDGWLRVRVTSKHKKSSKYAGSVNCVFLDIDREPDGLFFYSGDFWSILTGPGDDPEPMEEEREEDVRNSISVLSSPAAVGRQSRESLSPPNPALSGAGSGVPPVVPVQGSLAPNMVYTIPPPPPAVFYSREVIQRAKNLALHPSQEFMRYEIAQSLTHQDRKHGKGTSVFAKLRQLGAGRR